MPDNPIFIIMKKFIASLVALFTIATASAGNPISVFNHLGVGVSAGTTGISVEASTNITSFVQMRAGISMLPNFSFSDTYDVLLPAPVNHGDIDLKAGFGRTQGSVIFNIYPIPVASFYVAAGAYFGGRDLVKIKGHSADLAALQNNGQVEVGDYLIPVDKDGNVNGGLRVKGFRPYVGIGFGRAIPKSLLSVNFEMGVQFHGKPEIYSNHGEVRLSEYTNDDDIQKIIDKLKVWPVISLKLCGKIF